MDEATFRKLLFSGPSRVAIRSEVGIVVYDLSRIRGNSTPSEEIPLTIISETIKAKPRIIAQKFNWKKYGF